MTPPCRRHRGSPWARWRWVWLATLLAGAAWADERPGEAPEAPESEQRVKATYLSKFGAFVVWPDRSFSTPEAPVVIGIVDADGLADELALVAAGRSVQGRPMAVRKLRPGEAVPDVHMLFIGNHAGLQAVDVLDQVRALPVLTVADTALAGLPGTMIGFVRVDGRLRFDVAPGVAERVHLLISARLLSVAHRILDAASP